MTVRARPSGVSEWLERAVSAPEAVSDAGWVALLGADGSDLELLCLTADQRRAALVGDPISYVVNRNLDPAEMAADPALLTDLVVEARGLGATEICMQGLVPSRGLGYLELIAAVRTAAGGSGMHLHAFRPAELLDGAARCGMSVATFLQAAREAGLGSVPGTAARILDDRIRVLLSGGADLTVAEWESVIGAAHRAGLRSTATMVYGHIETPLDQVLHLRRLAAIQARTGGFTELILMPIQADQVPSDLADRMRGASVRETRALHAVARLLLAGRIDHLQAAWPKFGLEVAGQVLAGGADDLGGVLLDGALAPEAGPEAGSSLGLDELVALADSLDRPLRQRTTLYGSVANGSVADGAVDAAGWTVSGER